MVGGAPNRIEEILGGRYRVLELLGQGGMGSVFRALDEQTQQRVAVKILMNTFADDDSAETRFRHEISASLMFSHPNLVATVDSGRCADETPYFVMELVDGPSLFALLRREGALHPARALELARGIACGLEHMHNHGAIHRDIKPANVMVGVHESREVAKILDFGVIKATEGHELTVQPPTQTGLVIGSLSYMAPERLKGDVFDGRSDLYSLGCVLFEMLTGATPYVGEGVANLALLHLGADVPWLAERGVAVPEALDDLVRAMLAKAPSDRPESAAVVRQRIEEIRPLVEASRAPVARSGRAEVADVQAEDTAFLTPEQHRAAIQAQPTMLISSNTQSAPQPYQRAEVLGLIALTAVAVVALVVYLLMF